MIEIDNNQKYLLSVVLPIYNEENTLWDAVLKYADNFDKFVGEGLWQYVLVENGSKDNTMKIIEEIKRKWKNSKSIVLSKPNYGNALREGVLNSEGKWVLIMNVDHLWDSPYFKWAWENREQYDLIIGSKRADPTLNMQDQYRRLLSAGLNSLLMYLFDFVGAESHGMKLLNFKSMKKIAEKCIMRRGQFDTELTLRALRKTLWVAEVPMPYMEKRNPRNFMVKKIGQNIFDMFRLYLVMKKIPYEGQLRYRRFCRYDMKENDLINNLSVEENSDATEN